MLEPLNLYTAAHPAHVNASSDGVLAVHSFFILTRHNLNQHSAHIVSVKAHFTTNKAVL
jgi:hypothetical protein